jgi:hypothetical protein
VDVPPEWHLFVDESGDFSVPHARVCVAGLLLPGSDTPERREALRQGLTRLAPHVRVPLHAAELERASFHLIEFKRLPKVKRLELPAMVRELLLRAEQQLAKMEGVPPELVGAPGKISVGRLDELDDFLELKVPERFEDLSGVRDRVYRQFRSWLAQYLGGELGGYAVGATEVHGQPGPRPGEDRYLLLLEPFLERVLLLVDALGPGRLILHIATRDVQRADRPSPLTVADVEAVLSRTHRLGKGADVEVIIEQPERYGPRVHPGLVVADFLANRMRPRLTSSSSLRALDSRVWADTGLHVMLPTGRLGTLPTVASEGPPRKLVQEGLAGRPEAALENVTPRWTVEQAELVVAALAALGPREVT